MEIASYCLNGKTSSKIQQIKDKKQEGNDVKKSTTLKYIKTRNETHGFFRFSLSICVFHVHILNACVYYDYNYSFHFHFHFHTTISKKKKKG